MNPLAEELAEEAACIFAAAPKLPVFLLEVFNLWLKCG